MIFLNFEKPKNPVWGARSSASSKLASHLLAVQKLFFGYGRVGVIMKALSHKKTRGRESVVWGKEEAEG